MNATPISEAAAGQDSGLAPRVLALWARARQSLSSEPSAQMVQPLAGYLAVLLREPPAPELLPQAAERLVAAMTKEHARRRENLDDLLLDVRYLAQAVATALPGGFRWTEALLLLMGQAADAQRLSVATEQRRLQAEAFRIRTLAALETTDTPFDPLQRMLAAVSSSLGACHAELRLLGVPPLLIVTPDAGDAPRGPHPGSPCWRDEQSFDGRIRRAQGPVVHPSIVYGDAPLSPFLGRHGARMVVAQPMGAGARWLGTVLLGFERQPPLLPPDLRLFSAQVDELGSHVPWALRWSEAEAMRWPGSPPSSLGTRTEVAR